MSSANPLGLPEAPKLGPLEVTLSPARLLWEAAALAAFVGAGLAWHPARTSWWSVVWVGAGSLLLHGVRRLGHTRQLRYTGNGRWECVRRNPLTARSREAHGAPAEISLGRGRWRHWVLVDGRRYRVAADDARRIRAVLDLPRTVVYTPPSLHAGAADNRSSAAGPER